MSNRNLASEERASTHQGLDGIRDMFQAMRSDNAILSARLNLQCRSFKYEGAGILRGFAGPKSLRGKISVVVAPKRE